MSLPVSLNKPDIFIFLKNNLYAIKTFFSYTFHDCFILC
jgi:hypothetical protein